MIVAWAASAAAWGQDGQAPLAAGGQHAVPLQTQPRGDALTPDEIRARFEEQERKIADLQAQLSDAQQVRRIPPVTDAGTQGEAAKKLSEDASKAAQG